MTGIKKHIWSRGWSRDHTRRPILSYSFWINLLISLDTLSHFAGNN